MAARPRARLHLATCEHCGKKIAWSTRRRQWLALAPLLAPNMRHLARRLICPRAVSAFHDPAPAGIPRPQSSWSL